MDNEEIIPDDEYSYNITCIDVSVIQFDWLEEDIIDKSVCEIEFSIVRDIEIFDENIFLYHMDFRFEMEKLFYIHIRTVFRMEIEETNIFKFQPQIDMINMTYGFIKDAIIQYHEDAGKKFNPENFDDMPQDFLDDYVKSLPPAQFRTEIKGDGDISQAYKPYYTFKQDFSYSLLIKGTILVMDEIFFNNPSFNRKQNQLRLEQIIPPNFYLTFRNELNKLDKGEVALNFKKFVYLIVAIECVCHILTTDHLDYMEARLDSMKFGKEYRDEYIRIAEPFARDSKANIKKGGMTVGNWEDKYDWDKLIT